MADEDELTELEVEVGMSLAVRLDGDRIAVLSIVPTDYPGTFRVQTGTGVLDAYRREPVEARPDLGSSLDEWGALKVDGREPTGLEVKVNTYQPLKIGVRRAVTS